VEKGGILPPFFLLDIPTWDRRLRLPADWLIWPLVGPGVLAALGRAVEAEG